MIGTGSSLAGRTFEQSKFTDALSSHTITVSSIAAFRQAMGRIICRRHVRPSRAHGTFPKGTIGACPSVKAFADGIWRRAVPIAIAHAMAGGVYVSTCHRRSTKTAAAAGSVVRVVVGVTAVWVICLHSDATKRQGNAENEEERQRGCWGWKHRRPLHSKDRSRF